MDPSNTQHAKPGKFACNGIAVLSALTFTFSLFASFAAFHHHQWLVRVQSELEASKKFRGEDFLDFHYSEQDALAFVGGYTVTGHSITTKLQDAMVKTEVAAFSVEQECICSCSVTTGNGIFCLGANDGNAFNAVAYREHGQWVMQQHSINASVGGFNYHATFQFGELAGGAHSATGYALTAPGMQTTIQFRANQSRMGCNEGVGASACLPLCSSHGFATPQLESKCGLARSTTKASLRGLRQAPRSALIQKHLVAQ